MNFLRNRQHVDVLQALVVHVRVELREGLVDINDGFDVIEKVRKLAVGLLDVPQSFDEVLRTSLVHPTVVTDGNRRQRSIPIAIIPFKWDDGRISDVALVLLRADAVSAPARQKEQSEPHQSLERMQLRREDEFDPMNVGLLEKVGDESQKKFNFGCDDDENVSECRRRCSSIHGWWLNVELREETY